MARFVDFIGLEVRSKKGQILGQISYYEGWKKHVFEPLDNSFYDTICMNEISKELEKKDMLKKLNEGKT